MEMHQIRYFLAVAETLNFTRAAELCNVSQPALSRAVQLLEEEVGGLLFRRERNQTHLTDLGLLLRPRLQSVLENTREAKAAAQRFLTLDEAHVTLGVMCTIGPRRFMGLLADFQMKHPGIELRLIEGVPDSLGDRLATGELDLAIMAQTPGLPERFNSRPLYRERFTLAFPAGHRFEQMEAVPVAALKGENYLRRVNCEYRDYLAQLCEERDVGLRVSHVSEREDWIQNMVAAGLGVCFLPEYSAVFPGVQTRPVIDPEVWRDISLVSVAGRRFSPAELTFIDAVKRYRWAGQQEVLAA
ncbi:MAG TPA: LysR family transcriptional regulator [Kiloniellales bacterium]|nr:LysR family transcriptional regulator [Kiloniellales bacterium]